MPESAYDFFSRQKVSHSFQGVVFSSGRYFTIFQKFFLMH